jgi:tyrosyl-tRNA synthetase
MAGILATLRERGFVKETTDDAGLEKLLDGGSVTAYVGFDPTAPSLQLGNLVPILALAHLQRAGHRPIVIMGGGTGMVGDPSGKTEMRKLLGSDQIEENLEHFRKQFARFIDFSERKAIILDNARWLLPLNYIEFLREIGRHFSVNRMIAAECFKIRIDSPAGLTFLEFNYMLLQAYDFLELYRRHGCRLQLGGSDQWGNIVAGIDLIRRVEGGEAYGITIPLITTASGAKMGKTAEGTVWLAADKTTPYQFYQFWINTDDRDVARFLRLFTFLPIEEIRDLEKLEGADIRRAKEVLAYEATRIVHGEEEAAKAREAARALFGGGCEGGGSMPEASVRGEVLSKGIPAVNLAAELGLCKSKSEARRLAQQGGLYVNGETVGEDRILGQADLREGMIQLRAGKKKHLVVRAE